MKKDILRRFVWLVLGMALLRVTATAFLSAALRHFMGHSAIALTAFGVFLTLWCFVEAVWTKRTVAPSS
jgi:hypothetical protein